jgi:RNA polymerase sigma-70 factor, ECF subfamily
MLSPMDNEASSGASAWDRAAELELAAAAARHERLAERRVVELLMDRVRAIAHYLEAGDPDAEDDAQLAMVEILGSLGSFRGDSPMVRWADRIAVRTIRRHLARRRARERTVVRGTDLEQIRAQAGSAEARLSDDRLRERVAALLAKLKPNQRTALVLKLLLGHTIEEISEITGANRFTVDYRLRHGREQLRRMMRADPLIRAWSGERGVR